MGRQEGPSVPSRQHLSLQLSPRCISALCVQLDAKEEKLQGVMPQGSLGLSSCPCLGRVRPEGHPTSAGPRVPLAAGEAAPRAHLETGHSNMGYGNVTRSTGTDPETSRRTVPWSQGRKICHHHLHPEKNLVQCSP